MNIFLIHHRSSHHASNSGYGRLLDYLDAQVVYGSTTFPYRIAKIIAGLHLKAAGNYNVGSVLKAIELYKLLKKHKGQKNVVHFLNGERDIRHLGFFKKRFPNTRFIATFHKPPEVLKKTIRNVAALKKLDGAIAVGANQVSFIKDWLQLENVVYIPHGVDTTFFTPDPSIKKKNTLLFVGQHLRDFDTFNRTVPQLASKIPNLHINVVVHPAYTHKVEPHPSIKILTEIADAHLRTLYQEATLLYLPMKDSTACNSILEAMACGLPVITSDVGGNAIYLKNTINLLIEPVNEEGYVEKTILVMQDLQGLCEMGVQSRKKALEMNWESVVKELQIFYTQCLLKKN